MKIQLTQNITFPEYTNIPTMQKGTTLTLPHKKETKEYTLIMEYQDKSLFFDSYASLYYKTNNNNQILGILLQEKQDYKVLDKQKGKILKLTQTEFKLEEDLQTGLF